MRRTLPLAATVALLPLLAAAPAEARGLFGGRKPATTSATATASDAAKAAPRARATAEQRIVVERLDPLARAAFWANESNSDPADADAAVHLSSALRALGRFDEAGEAVARVLAAHPDHLEALLEAGRAKIGALQGFYAVEPLTRAAAAAPRDWRPHSLLGVAMEQVKRTADARLEYARALQLSPDNPAVLCNLALLDAAGGDRLGAEALLRRAVSQPGSGARERQNLALILGLGGRVDEAEALIRRDLPPELADANVAYLRSGAARPLR